MSTTDNTQLEDRIVRALALGGERMMADEICRNLTAHRREVQEALTSLQDADRVFMRNGFYWLSMAEYRRLFGE